MPINPLPIPLETPMVGEDRIVEFTMWVAYFVARDQQIADASKGVAHPAPLTNTSASLPATSLNVKGVGGFYRVNLYTRITRAATVSSSLTVTFRWTEGGQALSQPYPAITGNTTTTYLADVFPLRIDNNTSLTYETAYASVGGTTMTYSLEIACERLA